LVLTAKKDGYKDFAGHFVQLADGSFSFLPTENGANQGFIVSESEACNQDKSQCWIDYRLDLSLLPEQKEIFAGKVYTANPDGSNEQLATGKYITISLSGKDAEYFTINGESNKVNSDGSFLITGYRFDKKEKYVLTFGGLTDYEDIEQNVAIKKDTENDPKNPLKIVFRKLTKDALRQRNLEKITGFGCNELMPRYLVGANCEENKTLEGDATDLAVWIQKFGGKITSVITLLAVLLIIWNAFKIVSAAGDDTQISEAKKGIMWTIIGLALTMFAYIIVKTVIMLTYSQ